MCCGLWWNFKKKKRWLFLFTHLYLKLVTFQNVSHSPAVRARPELWAPFKCWGFSQLNRDDLQEGQNVVFTLCDFRISLAVSPAAVSY